MVCCYNRMVDCDGRKKCLICGWNPKVSAKRVAAVNKRLAEEKGTKRMLLLPRGEETWKYYA